MTDKSYDIDLQALADFIGKCRSIFLDLFDRAKKVDEVQFAIALGPEMRGAQDVGWNTAIEATHTLEDYHRPLEIAPPDSSMRVRVGLSLYCHLAEASGFYEVPKNMMVIASGGSYSLNPFSSLNRYHAAGELISPNATKVLKDLLGHAEQLGLEGIKNIILEAFDFDIRNGYAHADYVIWDDGLRLPKRNGGTPKVIAFLELGLKVNKAIILFTSLQNCVAESMRSYAVPRRTEGRLNSHDSVKPALISYSDEKGLSIQVGFGV